MATITARGQYWRARIRKGGLDLNRTFDSLLEAEAWVAAKRKPRSMLGSVRRHHQISPWPTCSIDTPGKYRPAEATQRVGGKAPACAVQDVRRQGC